MQKARVEKGRLKQARPKPRFDTFTDWARDAAGVITTPIARFLARLGFRPNTVTLIGSLLNVVVGLVLSSGRLTLGGWLLAVVAPTDALDGALARAVGQKSRFGAFLDSTLDRVSEAALLLGLATHFARQGAITEVILAFVALTGATLVSYTRARAEGIGVPCKVGILTRLERAVVLAVGLILGQPTITLWVLAVGSSLTALQRMLHVYKQTRAD